MLYQLLSYSAYLALPLSRYRLCYTAQLGGLDRLGSELPYESLTELMILNGSWHLLLAVGFSSLFRLR